MAARKNGKFLAVGIDFVVNAGESEEERYHISGYTGSNTVYLRKHGEANRFHAVKLNAGWQKLSLLDLVAVILMQMEQQEIAA